MTTDTTRPTSWLHRLLELGRDGDTFTAPSPEGNGDRLFGGLVAAQCLAAAGATTSPDKLPQSLHAYFVRSGQPAVDITLTVERTRDGRSFDTRRVTATQNGNAILEMLTSFHRPEPGPDWHAPAPPMVERERAVPMGPPGLGERFEIPVEAVEDSGWAGLPYWIRTRQPIEDDPLTQACALTFMSDLGIMATARPRGMPLPTHSGMAASLDHTIWFHRRFQPDQWHRYQADRLNNADSRGLATGAFYDAGGLLIATIAQEALWRS
jgi:acyl-CoA thioesterase